MMQKLAMPEAPTGRAIWPWVELDMLVGAVVV